MTIRNLDKVFAPKSVALIGASSQEGSVGAVLARNLVRGGLDAPVYPVNPNRDHVGALPCYKSLASLPEVPDLAVIATPRETVPGIVRELGDRGTKAAIVITAGFGEGGGERGKALRQEMLDAARPHLLRIIGPNCLGVMVPNTGLNASFGNIEPSAGRLAFVTQSGAVVTSVVDWAEARGIGFSHLVSLGGMSDVDFGDMLDYLATDRDARAILLYVESVTSPRKFMSAARAAARAKPVIVVKVGRFAEGARAAASHTGAMAGSDEVYDAVFRRSGLLRVYNLDELFDAAETLSKISAPKGDSLTILTNGGGPGVLATDALIAQGGRLAELAPDTIGRLNDVLPAAWSGANPVDIIGDAPADRYAASLEALLKNKSSHAILVLNAPTAIASGTEAARAVTDTVKSHKGARPIVLTNWLGGATTAEPRRLFWEHAIPTYDTPSDAVRAFMHMVRYRRSQNELMETPRSIPETFEPDTAEVRRLIDAALSDGRELLSEPEAKRIFAAYGIETTRMREVSGVDEVEGAAAGLGGPCVLKVVSSDISHKSDVGGVMLDLKTPQEAGEAARKMQEKLSTTVPDARIEGFVVQEMVSRPNAHELIIGMSEDAQFGPTILFGQGGTAVELIDDTNLGLPPLNMRLARQMIAGTRVAKLLEGYRDRPAADMEDIAFALVKISQLVTDFGEIKELDINPLLADEHGAMALDARIRVAAYEGDPHDRLAIQPYPNELEETIETDDGRELLLRPIRAEDEPMLRAGFAKLSPEDVYKRFHVPMKELDHLMAARLSQINYDRQMALIVTEDGRPGETEIYGVARLSADPDFQEAEYAVIVRTDMAGKGLGTRLMERLTEYARSRGLKRIYGDVLRDNKRMLGLCENLGMTKKPHPDERRLVRTWLEL